MSEDTSTSEAATDVKGDNPEVLMKENVVTRVISLPLISAMYSLCASLYNQAKERHPYFNKAAHVLETVTAVAVGIVIGGTKPVLNHVVPRISAVNKYVNQGLDRIEETLPCLHQQPTQLYEDGRNLTKTVVSSTVSTAKDAAVGAKGILTQRVAEAADITKDIVHDSVGLTKTVVASTLNTAREAAFGATDLMAHRVFDAVNLTKGTVQDTVDLTKSVMSSSMNTAKDAAFRATDLVANRMGDIINLTKGTVLDGVDLTISMMNSTADTTKDATFGATDLVTNRVNDIVNLTKGTVQDSVDLTKSVVTSSVNTAKDAAFGATDLVSHRVADIVNLTKGTVQDSVGLTKMVVNSTVNTAKDVAFGAKDIVTNRVGEIINLTKGTVQDSVDLTKSVVSSTVSTALQAAQGTRDIMAGRPYKPAENSSDQVVELTNFLKQMLASGVDAMLEKSERMLDQFLPVTQEELEMLATEVPDSKKASTKDGQQSYFIRLGSLSNKVRHRAYMHSISKLHILKESTQNILLQLQMVLNLVENVKQGVGQRFHEAQQKLHQVLSEWVQMQPGGSQTQGDASMEVESRTLTLLRLITQDLGPAYLRLMSSIEGLPGNVQEKVDRAVSNVRQLQASFSSATSFRDLSSRILVQGREQIAKAREALDMLVEYVALNMPLNWIVGPFRALPAGAEEVTMAETPASGGPERARKAPKDAGETARLSGAQKETMLPSQPLRAVPKTAKMPERAREPGKVKEAAKTQEAEEATFEMPKRAKREAEGREGETKKAGKSALNEAAEAPEKKP
ncbi:perilipin-3-like [Heteronotia binoei]|uniref:perilipin-3-like n=1 Tax=Heteronotia binoei TaxID=13085 RepID=UPI00292D2F5E|nr:perilipin-3-like [Heteronotia binoei]